MLCMIGITYQHAGYCYQVDQRNETEITLGTQVIFPLYILFLHLHNPSLIRLSSNPLLVCLDIPGKLLHDSLITHP
jgi:hypothetical protein